MSVKVPEYLFPYFELAGKTVSFTAGEPIYMQGEHANLFYLIKKGRVRVYYISSSGEELTLEIVEKGRIVGESSFLGQSVMPTSVSAVNDVELTCCTLEHLYPFIHQSKELTMIMFQLLSYTCSRLSNQLKRVTLYNRFERIASFLLDETGNPDADRNITATCIPYSHEELAFCLGLNRVTVTRVLKQFREAGLIELKYKKVIIVDREGLNSVIGAGHDWGAKKAALI